MGGSGSDGGRRKRVEVTKGRSERKERRRLLRGGLRKSVREGFLQNFNDDPEFIFFMSKYMLVDKSISKSSCILLVKFEDYIPL
jgi:hypothetical protein